MVLRRAIRIGRCPWIYMRLFRRIRVRRVEPRWLRSHSVSVLKIKIIVARDIPGLLGSLDLFEKLADDDILDHFPAFGINWMSNIRVKFRSPVGVFRRPG